MSPLSSSPTVLAASTVTTIGATLVVLLILGLLVYVWVNLRAGRDEVGSEIELAPNRKPYYDDETLETTVLNRTLRWALVLLVVIAVALPLYWLSEPSRQSGAIENFQSTFVARGELQYVEGSQCQNCHGPEGTGGQAPFTITDADGAFVAAVNWRAPTLDTVLLRFTREEVEYIINYGRPFSPMPGWGAAVNKGPLNEQQVTNLVDYLESIQLSSDEAKRQVSEALAEDLGLVEEGADDDAMDEAIDEHRLRRSRGRPVPVQPRDRGRRLCLRPLPHAGLVDHPRGRGRHQPARRADRRRVRRLPRRQRRLRAQHHRRAHPAEVRQLRRADVVHQPRQHRRRGVRQQRHRQRPHARLRRQPQHRRGRRRRDDDPRDDRGHRPIRREPARRQHAEPRGCAVGRRAHGRGRKASESR